MEQKPEPQQLWLVLLASWVSPGAPSIPQHS